MRQYRVVKATMDEITVEPVEVSMCETPAKAVNVEPAMPVGYVEVVVTLPNLRMTEVAQLTSDSETHASNMVRNIAARLRARLKTTPSW